MLLNILFSFHFIVFPAMPGHENGSQGLKPREQATGRNSPAGLTDWLEVRWEQVFSAIQWHDLFAALFVMCPHTYYLHDLHVIEDLIDKTLLNVYSSRESPSKITH
jgi:hypothetical protein